MMHRICKEFSSDDRLAISVQLAILARKQKSENMPVPGLADRA